MYKLLKISGVFYGLLLVTITFVTCSSSVLAGEYHNSDLRAPSGVSTLACAQCHTMHGTQGQGAGGGSSPNLLYQGDTTLNAKLLRANTVLDLCLTCHEANDLSMSAPTPPDISNNAFSGTYTASAGDYAHGGFVNESNRHSIGLDFGTDLPSSGPPGYTGTWANKTTAAGVTFNCVYCHSPHGTKSYRNLRYDPGNPANDTEGAGVVVSYATWDGTTLTDCSDGVSSAGGINCDVFNTKDPLVANNLTKYDRGNVEFSRDTASTNYNRISEWCGKCHNNFFGESNAANMGGVAGGGVGGGDDDSSVGTAGTSPWVRHPVGDVYIGQNTHNDVITADLDPARIRYATDTDYSAAKNFASIDEQPLCLSCHYAHGGGNPNGGTGDANVDHSILVKLDDSNVLNIEAGHSATTGLMRNTCNACHNQ